PARQERGQMLARALDVLAVLRLGRQLHGVLGVRHLRIGAEQQVRKGGERRVQVLGDRAFALARVDDAQEVGRGREALAQRGELLLEDLRDAGQDVDVLALDGREAEPASTISSLSSGMGRMRSSVTPRLRSSRARKGELVSTTLPERISLPMTMMPAVRSTAAR